MEEEPVRPIRPPRHRDGEGEETPTHPPPTTSNFNLLVQSAFVATASAQSLDSPALTPPTSSSSSVGGGVSGRSARDREAAFAAYDAALQSIDKAIASAPSLESSPTTDVQTLLTQLRCTRKQILERVSDLQHGSDVGGLVEERGHDFPPPYSEPGVGGSGVSGRRMDMDSRSLEAALDEIASEEERDWRSAGPLPLSAREVYSIPQEVQIYFISSDDNVSAPSYPSFLRLVTMEPEPAAVEGGEGAAVVAASVPAFLQVGEWTYPLIPHHSPVFRSSEGIYIFPDLSSNIRPGEGVSYVGLILPDSVDSSQGGRAAFERSLLSLVGLQSFPPVLPPQSTPIQEREERSQVLHHNYGTTPITTVTSKEKPPRPPAPGALTSSKLSQEEKEKGEEEEEEGVVEREEEAGARRLSTKIASGAEAVSRRLMAGASKTSSLLDRGANYINSKIEPAKEKPVVKPEVKAGMKTARGVTGKAVQLSGFIVSQVGRGTIVLGRYMAPHVHRASTKFLASTHVATDEEDASAKVDQMLEVTTGAVVGFGTVYFGLEHAGRTLVSSLATNSVRIVQHRYGDEVGECTADGLASAGNTALTAWNTKNLAPKAVAKRVAKDTGRMVVKAHQEKEKGLSPGGGGKTKEGGGGGGS